MKRSNDKTNDILFSLWQKFTKKLNLLFPFMVFKGNCRFYPTCSDYARQAVSQYGMIRGVGMGFLRILRCHPFNKGGHDPVR